MQHSAQTHNFPEHKMTLILEKFSPICPNRVFLQDFKMHVFPITLQCIIHLGRLVQSVQQHLTIKLDVSLLSWPVPLEFCDDSNEKRQLPISFGIHFRSILWILFQRMPTGQPASLLSQTGKKMQPLGQGFDTCTSFSHPIVHKIS